MPTTVQTFTRVYTFEPIDPPGSPAVQTSSFTYNSVWAKSGVSRPKPPRWKAPTPYTRVERVISSSLSVNCLYEQRKMGLQKAYRRTLFGDIRTIDPLEGYLPPPSSQQELLNAAIKGMVDSKFNLLTSIAEFRKTAEHLASVANRLTAAVKDVKRARFQRAASRLGIVKPKGASRSKTWASNWLEYKYGWMPLVSDAYGIAEHLATLMRDEAPIFMSRKRAVAEDELPIRTGKTAQHTFEITYQVRGVRQSRRQVCLYYQVDFSSLLNLKRLGLLDPGATAWEAVPWSFVVDWFAPVGEWLSLVNSWQGLIYKGSCHTTTQKIRATVRFVSSRCTSATSAVVTDFGEMVRPGVMQTFNVSRNVIADPNYRFQTKVPMGFDKAITAISLLRQQFK